MTLTLPPGVDVWVEFNDIDQDGHTTTYSDLTRPGLALTVGMPVTAGDGEGSRCPATVVGITERTTPDGTPEPNEITLRLDLTRFRSQP